MAERWQSPRTTRRYLHPPMSQRLSVLFCEGKVIFGEAVAEITRNYGEHVSSGLWFLRGDEREAFDFKKGENLIPEDGIPHHGVRFREGGLTYTVEGVSECGRVDPETVIRLTVENEGEETVTDRVCFLLRTGKEADLVPGSPDIYASYAPTVDAWFALPSTWREEGGMLTDGDSFVLTEGDIPFSFDAEGGVGTALLTLGAGERVSTCFVYGKGEIRRLDYETVRRESLSFWQGEFARMDRLPEGVRNNAEVLRTIKNLTVQLLQCFSVPIGGDGIVLARQGGLQRQIWTFESMPVLEALGAIGDYDSYIEPILDCYFTTFFTESGEIKIWGNGWAMVTGNVLYSFSKYAIRRGVEYYSKYRDRAFMCFDWMRSTRLSVVGTENIAPGLFPPLRGSDDPLVFQSWSTTDTCNLCGVEAFADVVEHFRDPRANEVRAEYLDYFNACRREWERYLNAAGDTDEVDFPVAPRGDLEQIQRHFEFVPNPPVHIFRMSEREADLLYNYRARRGNIHGGLYYRMLDKNDRGACRFNLDENGICTVWYVSYAEFEWFNYYMSHGNRESALEIIEANRTYAMSKEYYMCERYKETDPWFAPWMPNASANGRTILMLLDYYGQV